MALKDFLRSRKQTVYFSPELDGDEPARLREEFLRCLSREDGRVATARRAEGLVALCGKLSPAGRARFAAAIGMLEADPSGRTTEHYASVEFAELMGRASSRAAFADMFESPRRRLLKQLGGASGGPAMLAALREVAPPALAAEIDGLTADRDGPPPE